MPADDSGNLSLKVTKKGWKPLTPAACWMCRKVRVRRGVEVGQYRTALYEQKDRGVGSWLNEPADGTWLV